ncbi:MAG: hypothetical protein ACR2LC_14285 [Pyrinomonadaceae bacterium]
MMIANLRIRTDGKASKRGENVYKVGAGASILANNGWQIVRRPSIRSPYTYMKAPIVQRSKTFTVQIEIPTDDELLAFAEELHAHGANFEGMFQGWKVRYTPAITRPASSQMVIIDGQIKHLPVSASDDPAHFNCDGDAWGYSVIFETPVRTHKHGEFVDELKHSHSARKRQQRGSHSEGEEEGQAMSNDQPEKPLPSKPRETFEERMKAMREYYETRHFVNKADIRDAPPLMPKKDTKK